MNAKELHAHMCNSFEPDSEDAVRDYSDWVVPAAFLPRGDWEEDLAYMNEHGLDGMTWPEGDAIPEGLGRMGRLWMIQDDRLWVAGIAGGGPFSSTCYWVFKRVG
jgi:hypothetical protein